MRSRFHKISRVGNLAGGTRWYLSDDCLLAAKRSMYVVEYHRFYLRDLESIVVWPSRLWPLRLLIPFVLLAALGASLWQWANSTAGEIFTGIALGWLVLELALGQTAQARVRATGVSVDLPLVKRARRARKVLAIIDEAVRASRDPFRCGCLTNPWFLRRQRCPQRACAMLAAYFIRYVKRPHGVHIAVEHSAVNALPTRRASSPVHRVCAGWRVRPHPNCQ